MDFEMPFRRITTNEVLMFAGSSPAVPTEQKLLREAH